MDGGGGRVLKMRKKLREKESYLSSFCFLIEVKILLYNLLISMNTIKQ